MLNKLKQLFRRLYWIIKNYSLLEQFKNTDASFYYGPITYNTDGLATCINCDFINTPRFQKAYQAAAATNPWPGFTLQWRVYIVCFFADHVKSLTGDFVECGVNTGAYAKAIITYTEFNKLGKTFHLLDTYDGLVPELVSDEEKKAGLDTYLSQYKNVYEGVVKTFQNDNVNIIRGTVPGTLPQCSAEKIAYLSIDMNNVAPEIAAAEYFYDKVVPGGVIILDDYGFPQHINQKKAFDLFAQRKGIQILSLPTGQGIIFKK
jgi:O-methyltransferase